MAIAHVQDVSGTGSGTSVAAAITSTAGNTLVAFVGAYILSNTPFGITSITDFRVERLDLQHRAEQSEPAGRWELLLIRLYVMAGIGFCVNAAAVTSVTFTPSCVARGMRTYSCPSSVASRRTRN